MITQVTQTTLALIASLGGVFLATGLAEFRIIVVILFIIEAARIGFGNQPANRLANMLVYVAIIYAVLSYYQTGIPGVGRNVTQIVSDAGISMAQVLDTTIDERVGTAVAKISGQFGGSAWNIVLNTGAAVRYFIIVLALAAVAAAVLAVTAYGFLALGVIILVGPVLIPFALIPGLDWLATGWFRSLIGFSLYPIIGQAFVYVIGTVLLGFFDQFGGPMDTQKAAALFLQIVIICMASVFGILKVPHLVSAITSGSSGLSAMPSIGWWR